MTISSYRAMPYIKKNDALTNYSLAYSAMTVAVSLSFVISNQLTNWSLSVMSITTARCFIFKEVMGYDMIPKAERFIYLGLAKSGFMVGDVLGAPIASLIFPSCWGKCLTNDFRKILAIKLLLLYHLPPSIR